ncbi:hypothetical protein BDR26DRAFT_979039, partial [Obelidium mucronatum]
MVVSNFVGFMLLDSDCCLEIKPFYLYPNTKYPWMCPVTAYLIWKAYLHRNDIAESKYLFRSWKLSAAGMKITTNQLTADKFIDVLHYLLADTGRRWYKYGTHSFRRGGCQYLHNERRWNYNQICDWGGWSLAFDNFTIVRYLHGVFDDSPYPRIHLMDFNYTEHQKCGYCNRSCACS